MKTIGMGMILAFTSVLSITSCKKEKKAEVAPAPATPAATSTAKVSAAIDARVGTFKVTGIIDGNIYTAVDNKTLTVTKIGETKIKIAPVNFTMGTYELEVKNGTVVTEGVVSGSEDGKAIGYVGTTAVGKIIFACQENNTIALVVEGSGSNDVTLAGEK